MECLFKCSVLSLLLALGGNTSTASTRERPEAVAQELARLKAAANTAGQAGRKDLQLKDLRRLRDLLAHYGSVDSALAISMQVTELSGFSSDRNVLATDWYMLSDLAKQAGDLEGALRANKRLLLVAQSAGVRSGVAAEARLEHLQLLLELGRAEEFRTASNRIQEEFSAEGNLRGQLRVLQKQGDHYNGQGRWADALSLLHAVLRNEQVLEPREQAQAWIGIATANAGVKNWEAAASAYKKATTLYPAMLKQDPALYGLLSRIKEGQGDIPGALLDERRRNLAHDSLLTERMTEYTTRLQMLYGMRTQAKELEKLQAEGQLVSAELLAERIKLHAVLLFCGALSVLVLLLFMLRVREHAILRRNRIRHGLIAGQIRMVESERIELKEQNRKLSQALDQATSNPECDSGPAAGGNELHLVQSMLQSVEKITALDRATAMAIVGERLAVLDLTQRHSRIYRPFTHTNVKAHFRALADMACQGLEKPPGLQLRVDDGLDLGNTLIPLSLLYYELLLICIAGNARGNSVEISLARSGGQFEFTFAESAFLLNSGTLASTTPSGALVRCWTGAMDGSVVLLKGVDTMALQCLFNREKEKAIRMAS